MRATIDETTKEQVPGNGADELRKLTPSERAARCERQIRETLDWYRCMIDIGQIVWSSGERSPTFRIVAAPDAQTEGEEKHER